MPALCLSCTPSNILRNEDKSQHTLLCGPNNEPILSFVGHGCYDVLRFTTCDTGGTLKISIPSFLGRNA